MIIIMMIIRPDNDLYGDDDDDDDDADHEHDE